MPLTKLEEKIVVEEQAQTESKVVLLRMNRPRPGVVVYESPQFNVHGMFIGQPLFEDGSTDYTKCLRQFVDETIREFLPPNMGVHLLVSDAAWNTDDCPPGCSHGL